MRVERDVIGRQPRGHKRGRKHTCRKRVPGTIATLVDALRAFFLQFHVGSLRDSVRHLGLQVPLCGTTASIRP